MIDRIAVFATFVFIWSDGLASRHHSKESVKAKRRVDHADGWEWKEKMMNKSTRIGLQHP